MIKKLRIKITLLSVLTLAAVLILINIAHSAVTGVSFRATADKTLLFIARRGEGFVIEKSDPLTSPENGDDDAPEKDKSEKDKGAASDDDTSGDFASDFGYGAKITAETAYETRYFSVLFDKNGNVKRTDLSHIAEVTESDAVSAARNVISKNDGSGTMFYYRYLVSENEDGSTEVFFLNCTANLRSMFFSRFTVAAISAAVLIVMFFVVWLGSKKIVVPFIENLNTQKQFITNAGHEIKTPIAIIAANTEVLKMTEGENEWLSSIENQTARLSKLVSRLVSLSKADEKGGETLIFEKFSLSDALYDTAGAFSAPASQRGVKLKVDIEPDVFINGDERTVRQLCEILLDNAVKYCAENGVIDVSLKSKLKSVHLDVTNNCIPPDKKKLDRLFDRFYRADDSRARNTGGYGIGLSIAKAIADKHKAKISVSAKDDSITFSVVF